MIKKKPDGTIVFDENDVVVLCPTSDPKTFIHFEPDRLYRIPPDCMSSFRRQMTFQGGNQGMSVCYGRLLGESRRLAVDHSTDFKFSLSLEDVGKYFPEVAVAASRSLLARVA